MSRAAEFCKIAVDDDGRLSALICRKLNMRLPVERIAGSLGFLLGGKLAGIALLTTHSCIERCFLYENGAFLAFHQGIHDLILCSQCGNF